MTSWKPNLPAGGGHLYLALADALAEDIESGTLAPGARLPTHRALARELGVNIGTVTRAYAEARTRGLIDGEVGRGSFVRHSTARPAPAAPEGAVASAPPDRRLDLSVNSPAGGPDADACAAALRAIAARSDLASCFDAYVPAGLARHRAAGVRWLTRAGVEAEVDRVLITGGAQHAMAVGFAALGGPGDGVLTEALTYPGLKSLAGLLRLRLHGVEMDAGGILPEALEQAARRTRARFLYLVPNLHNPTGAILAEERRRAVAEIARRHELVIVEDDSHGFLLPKPATPAPIATFAPERTLFIASLSKPVCAGLRIAYLLAPRPTGEWMPRLVAASSAIAWMGAPLMAELAAQWIEDGTAVRIAGAKRAEIAARRKLADSVLGSALGKLPGPASGAKARAISSASAETSATLWLELDDPWRASELVARCRARGVAISPPDAFAVQRSHAPHAVRLCIGTPRTRDDLREALAIVAEVLRAGPAPVAMV